MLPRGLVRLSQERYFMTGKRKVTRESLEAQFSSLCRNFDDSFKTFLSSNGFAVFPGFCDVHVHFREPGFSYKETVGTGSRAAAHGGYTAVCTMPNLNPVPDSREHLDAVLAPIRASETGVNVLPYGALTVGEAGEIPADLDAMAPDVIAFSDDGRGVQSESMMRSLMEKCASLGMILSAHCEDNSLLHGGYIHEGTYAAAHGHRGICSESEWGPIKRDLRLAKETGCAYHVCHISTRESVALIREAKAAGVNVTCETGPHYLILDDGDLQEDGRFKMNPPLRAREDREALIEGVCDGTIDMIATDHAPHSGEEKSRGLEKSAFGVVGLETAFPALYTHLVKEHVISLEKLVELLAWNPRTRFGIPLDDAYTVWDLEKTAQVDPASFLSLGRATPFEGMVFSGECVLTSRNGKTLYQNKEIINAHTTEERIHG